MFILRVHLVPKIIFHAGIGQLHKNTLLRLDRTIRETIRLWLKLPKDTPTAFFHTRAREGGLQIWQLDKWIPLLKERQRQRLLNSVHPIITHMRVMTPNFVGKAILPTIDGNVCKTKEDLYKYTSESLYRKLDGKGLKYSKNMPSNHTWKIHGTKLQTGKSFVSSIKVHGNLLATQARSARGRNETPMCNAGCNSRASLSHIAQACVRTHFNRVKRHDALVKFLDDRLQQLGFSTIIEPKIRTPAGLRKPDLVAHNGTQAYVIDAQVINDVDDPDTTFQQAKALQHHRYSGLGSEKNQSNPHSILHIYIQLERVYVQCICRGPKRTGAHK